MKAVKKLQKKSEAEEVEEVTAVEETETVGEVTEVADEVIDQTAEGEIKMVRVAVNREISPAPRVGNVCMVRDFSVTKLVPGVYDVPEAIALVLIDKGAAQRVS